MYKLVVLCSVLAVVAATPSNILAPLAYSSTVLSPATTTITRQASSVVHPSPLLYSSPLVYPHFIKKRSAPFALNPYLSPVSYGAASPLIASTYSAPIIPSVPLIHSSPLVYGAYGSHFIKKRSAPFALNPYLSPVSYAAASPLIASTYSSPIIPSLPLVHSSPLVYGAYGSHFIKKRSVAPIALGSYLAPASYSTQSRIDLQSSPLITSYTSPYAYTSPIGYPSYYAIKK